MRHARVLLLAASLLGLAGAAACGRTEEAAMPASSSMPHAAAGDSSLALRSPAFAPGQPLPMRFTCEAEGVSPPLQWSGVPEGARSLALIVEDPDAPDPAAPQRVFVHWVLYDLPADSDGLPEGVAAAQLPAGTRQGRNDWKRTGFGAACPPVGRHRYVHRLYALDIALPDLHEPDKARLLAAMEGHVLAQAELVGTYEKRAH
jgi:Raf kinase inhibitor-like YbhB/YbcL family protein